VKIFVSYSRRGAGDFAEQIQSHFASFGHYEVFTDVNSIKAGDMWSDTIEDNISSCDIFVMIVTNGALQSPHVENEVLQAQREKKRIIPCFHRNVIHSEIKWGLNKIQGVKFEDKYELARNLYSKITKDKPGFPDNGREQGISTSTPPLKPPENTTPPRKLKWPFLIAVSVAAVVAGLVVALSIVNQPPTASVSGNMTDGTSSGLKDPFQPPTASVSGNMTGGTSDVSGNMTGGTSDVSGNMTGGTSSGLKDPFAD
jgi:TIR domain